MSVMRVDDHGPLGNGRPARSFGLSSRVAMGTLVIAALVLGIGGWTVTAKLAGAVISADQVIVDDNLKAVQDRDGGIVSDIPIREGDVVEAGQVILRLDDVQSRAELSIMRSQMLELAIRKARIVAERDGLPALIIPDSISRDDPKSADIVVGETRLFEGQRTDRESRKNQLEYGILQINDEVAGLESQRLAKVNEIALVGIEYKRSKELADKDLFEVSRLSPIKREEARLTGELGAIDASVARAKTRIFEIK